MLATDSIYVSSTMITPKYNISIPYWLCLRYSGIYFSDEEPIWALNILLFLMQNTMNIDRQLLTLSLGGRSDTVVQIQHLDIKHVCMYSYTVVFAILPSVNPITFYLFFSVPVIPQTGLPGGGVGGAGKKAAKVPGFVDSTINS